MNYAFQIIESCLVKRDLTFSLLMTIQEAFVDSADQDQTVPNM